MLTSTKKEKQLSDRKFEQLQVVIWYPEECRKNQVRSSEKKSVSICTDSDLPKTLVTKYLSSGELLWPGVSPSTWRSLYLWTCLRTRIRSVPNTIDQGWSWSESVTFWQRMWWSVWTSLDRLQRDLCLMISRTQWTFWEFKKNDEFSYMYLLRCAFKE